MADQVTALAHFLFARINWDWAAAVAASTRGAHWSDSFGSVQIADENDHWGDTIFYDNGYCEKEAVHTALWDPARVLAECEAKRWIVRSHKPDPLRCMCCQWAMWPCPTLLAVAGVYRDHPDYKSVVDEALKAGIPK